jgi:hypothetical protein
MKRMILAVALVAVLPGCGSGGAVDLGAASDHVSAAKFMPNHFPVLPPVGAHPSAAPTGPCLVSAGGRDVYADGRMIWQKWSRSGAPLVKSSLIPTGATTLSTGLVQQRLIPRGARLLRSKILATGLFPPGGLTLGRRSFEKHEDASNYEVRTHGHVVLTQELPPSIMQHPTVETPAQARARARLDALLADPTKYLPAAAWADRTIRPYIPSHFTISDLNQDGRTPDPSRLPPPADTELAQHTGFLRNGYQVITTNQARALIQAFQKAGIPPARNNAAGIDYDFAGMHMGPNHQGDLGLSPLLPHDCVA